ncbi:M24 family metallopeptidase [Celerinatantimonas sp. MCCC 1A17872]|uniref:M24 family metallopeptidase n=1 Tax=Celerinatantimonas sp. MCCC 1A17872 TaxID=3177514 RepID=UPI0038BFACA6
MMIYEPWFSVNEYEARVAHVRSQLAEHNCQALIAFLPETVTYLTGFFTRGYSSFQCVIIPLEGEPMLVCRDVESFYVDATSIYKRRALWSDSDNPVSVAIAAIKEVVGDKGNIGIDMLAWSLSYGRFHAIEQQLPALNWCDFSGILERQRFIKSAAEIDLMRAAAKTAEAGMYAGIKNTGVGVTERELAAEICSAMIKAGSDLPGPGVLSSGERAFHLHGGYSDRVLQAGDIVQLEVTPNVKHYHARFMRPIKVQHASDEDLRTVEQLIEIQNQALAEVRPGVKATIPDAIYRDGALSQGLRDHYSNKTFYSIGLLLQPNGGESLQAEPCSDWCFEVGMTFHTYILAKGFGMSESIVITEQGYERLTNFSRQLFVSSL